MKPKLSTAKTLLSANKLPLDANSFFNGLIICGKMKVVQYESTTGSGEIKYYMQLTDEGAAYGENKASGWHEFKTEPKFYEHMFIDAYLTCCDAIGRHARDWAATKTPPNQ